MKSMLATCAPGNVLPAVKPSLPTSYATIVEPRADRLLARSSMNGNGNGVATTVLTSPSQIVYAPDEVFQCPEESLFYSQCLQRVLTGSTLTNNTGTASSRDPIVVEFGAGDGSPVIEALLKAGSKFQGRVHGFELNPRAAGLASSRSKELGLNNKYQVRHSCFFKGAEQLRDEATWLVANPPYIPAPDNDILMPELHGGVDGADLTNELLHLNYPNAMLLVSSYSNPLGTIEVAKQHGYSITDFMVTALPFGTYSSEPKVKNWIRHLKTQGKAFFSERPSVTGSSGWYLLAGVVFQKATKNNGFHNAGQDEDEFLATVDTSDELIRVMTAL